MKNILNILIGVMMAIAVGLAAYAAVSGGSETAVGLNLIWAYTLVALGIAASIVCALLGVISSPEGLKGTVISLVLGVLVIGVSYYIASGHTIQILDLGTGGFFDAQDTIITEASVLVTYVIFGASVAVALITEIWGVFK